MNRTLHILHLEDNAADAELIHSILQKEGLKFTIQRVETRQKFSNALTTGSFDLIISDFTLPSYDGMAALKLAQKVASNVPFIFVSGTIGEESAIHSLLSGATDYVLKHRMERLVPAVRRALGEVNERVAKEEALAALVQRESSFRLLFEHSPLPMWVYDVESLSFLGVNDAALAKYGYSREEFLRMRITEIRPHEDVDRLFERIAQDRPAIRPPSRWRHLLKNGQMIDVEIISHTLEFNGKSAVLVVAQDITERLQGERIQRAVYRISHEAGYAASMADLYKNVHTIISEVMPASNFYIALYDEKEDVISFPYFIDEVDKQSPPQKAGKGLTEYVLRKGKSLLCDARTHQELMKSGEAELVGAPSSIWLGVPLTIGDKIAGVMVVQDYKNERSYGKREQQILEFVSAQVGRAIQRQQGADALSEAHQQLASLYDNLDLAVFSVDIVAGKMLKVSSAHEKVFGFRPEKFFENPQLWYEMIVPEDKHVVDAGYPILAAGKTLRHEYRIQRPDGRIVWIEARMKPTLDEKGLLRQLDGIASDITERKLAEEAMRVLERRFREMLETVNLIAVTVDRDGILTFCNDHLLKVTGWEREDILMKDWFSRIVAGDTSLLKQMYFDFVASGHIPPHYERAIWTKSGQLRNIRWSSTLLRDVNGEIVGTAAIGEDITEQAKAAEELRKSEEELRALFGAMMDVIMILDKDGRYVKIAPTNPLNLYRPPNELQGRTVHEILPKRDADLILSKIKECLESRETINYEYSLSAGGRVVWFDSSISPLSDSAVFWIARDVTQRKEAEQRVTEQASLLELASDAIIVRDLQDQVLFWNKGAEQLYGWARNEVVGKRIQDILYKSTEEHDSAKNSILASGSWLGELRQQTKSGKEVIVNSRWTLVRDDSGDPKSVLVINTDITGKKHLESQLMRAQRLESIGTLAGGIAHDLNNALGPILLGVQVIAKHVTDDRALQLLKSMEGSAKRGANMVRQILAFAKGLSGEFGVLSPRHIIGEVERIIHETFPKNIELEMNADKSLWSISGDATQLHQLLINLCVNARDAMLSGGRLTITAENFSVDSTYIQMHAGLKAGPHVLLKVADTGSGIPKDTLDKIFDPFFTTKEPEKGTGLGLSTVATIVKGHGGVIDVYSEVNHGTTFRVLIPAIPSTEAQPAAVLEDTITRGRGETVLVVDDEVTLREMTRQVLEMFGYTVLVAADGTEAITQFIGQKGAVQLVITDMAMPIMDGEATIRALRKIDPTIRIIATSGQHDAVSDGVVKRLDITKSITKPFTAEQLLRMVSEVLASGGKKE